VYLDHLNNKKMNLELWVQKREELLIELLENMAKGYVNIEIEQQSIRIGLIELLNSQRALPVTVIDPQEQSNTEQVETALTRRGRPLLNFCQWRGLPILINVLCERTVKILCGESSFDGHRERHSRILQTI
jgi:hypothetical protein